jgi:hypothetical protein
MAKISERKNLIPFRTEDGFERVRLTVNLSLPCWHCSAYPREFLWKGHRGKKTEVYCLPCPRPVVS